MEGRPALDVFWKTGGEVGRDQSRRRSDEVRIGVVPEMRKSRISKLDQSRRGERHHSVTWRIWKEFYPRSYFWIF